MNETNTDFIGNIIKISRLLAVRVTVIGYCSFFLELQYHVIVHARSRIINRVKGLLV